ncbi:MAG: O-antigen ligase family protein [Oscillospiraceae bacterium]|nr:O-antigen ligase family protein [Oscillospiraceae bacterium]
MPKAVSNSFPERKKIAMYAKIDMWQVRAARLLVILLICIQPLYLSPERYIRLTYHKWSFLMFSMVIVLLCVFAIWAYRLTRNPRLLPQDKLRYFDWAVLLFALVTLVSTIFSPFRDLTNVWIGIEESAQRGGRYDGAITQLSYVAIFFIISRWYRPNIKDFMIFGVSASLVALIGIFQFYGMDFFSLWPNHLPGLYHENFFDIFFRSTIGNVNIVATYVTVAILLCGFLFIRTDPDSDVGANNQAAKCWYRYLLLAASALNFWLMDISGSDSGLAGVGVTIFFAIPFIIERRRYLGRALILFSSWVAVFTVQRLFFHVHILGESTVRSLWPFVMVYALLLIVGMLLVKLGKERIFELPPTQVAESEPESNGLQSDAVRTPEAPIKWKLGVILIAATIVIGLVGVEIMGREEAVRGEGFASRLVFEAREVMHGNLRDEMGSGRIYIWRHTLSVVPDRLLIGYGPDTFEFSFPREAQYFMDARFDTAHNEYLQILVSQGVLGILTYVVFLVGIFLAAVRRAFKNPLTMAVLAAFFGYGIQAFFNISLPIVSQMLWVFAGMLASRKFDLESKV